MTLATLFVACGLAAVHLLAGKLHFLQLVPRSSWLSAAGGISVAYVFLHLLPELAHGQEIVARSIAGPLAILDHHTYLVAFAGLVAFYGLERLAKRSHKRGARAMHAASSPAMFWLHVSVFSLYNLLIGYLLTGNQFAPRDLALFFIAIGLHFLINDFGLRDHYKQLYVTAGRWLLAIAVLAGWAMGMVFAISELGVNLLIAFLAGGIILNVLKEELPEERESRFSAFLIGGAFYTILVITL